MLFRSITTNPLTYDLLATPAHPAAQASAADLAIYNTAKAVQNKKNAQALGLIQATVLPVIWQNHIDMTRMQLRLIEPEI